MGLFGKKKNEAIESVKGARVKVLGSDCDNCHSTAIAVKEALAELGENTDIEFVEDLADIVAYGVMTTPSIVIDDKVVSKGDTLNKKEALKLLKEEM